MSDKKYPWNKLWKNENSGAEDEVYAGPEYFEQSSDAAREPDPSMMMRVYEGPEYCRKKRRNKAMEGVYAGPPDPPPVMCTYAGPEFYNGTDMQTPIGAPAPAFVPERTKICAQCGAVIDERCRFCTSCGVLLPEEE